MIAPNLSTPPFIVYPSFYGLSSKMEEYGNKQYHSDEVLHYVEAA